MTNKYNPTSYFYTDLSLLTFDSGNYNVDAFGPTGTVDSSGNTTQYRTTSKIRTSGKTKVFAICKGKILIQPNTDDPDNKVNLILKPDNDYSPLKIRYLIYRGIDKVDLVGDLILQPTNPADPNQPILLQKIWTEYINFNLSVQDPDQPPTPPDIFPAFLIGYDPDNQNSTNLIDKYFFNSSNDSQTLYYQIPDCESGDHIGNFSDILGLDIVLDYGDFVLDNLNEVFNVDMAFARKGENVLDLSNPSLTTPGLQKRYKEYTHQFIDAAAFWGSHMNCGTINVYNVPNFDNSNGNISTNILAKYQTKNKLYIYISAERERSYNYFLSSRQILGFSSAAENNNTSGWPILIKNTIPSTATGTTLELAFGLNYDIDGALFWNDRHTYIDVFAANNNDLSSFPVEGLVRGQSKVPGDNLGLTGTTSLNFEINGTQFCAGFLFVFASLQKTFPLISYYNTLWVANLLSPLNLTSYSNTSNLIYSSVYDKNSVLEFTQISNMGGSVFQKVVYDTGLDTSTSSQVKRRLFVTCVKKSSRHNGDAVKFNVERTPARIVANIQSTDDYSKAIYDDLDFRVYRSQFTDIVQVNSLSIVNRTDFEKKVNYYQLGITESEYLDLIDATPVPTNADKVFLYLQEDTTNSNEYRRYFLGLQYEDNTGSLVVSMPASSPVDNRVMIYTIDGFYFFSAKFSNAQIYYDEFSHSNISFRPKSDSAHSNDWHGEIGFDWLRKGDTNLLGDNLTNDYFDNIGHYYNGKTIKTQDGNGTFTPEDAAWIKYRNSFPSYPAIGDNLMYSGSYISIYPSLDSLGNNTSFPKMTNDGTPKCITNFDIDLIINILSIPISLSLQFETVFFTITPQNLSDFQPKTTSGNLTMMEFSDKSTTGSNSRTIRVNLKSLNEFSIYKKIQIIADGKITGEIYIAPNSKANRKQLKIAFVNCKTNINGTDVTAFDATTQTANILENKIAHALNQAFVDPSTIDHFSLDLTKSYNFPGNIPFNFNKSYVVFNSTTNLNQLIEDNTDHLHEDLLAALKIGNASTVFDDYMVIFFIGEAGITSKGDELAGRAEAFNSRLVNVYKAGITDSYSTSSPPGINDTAPHELLHGLTLYHIFSNNGYATIKEFATTNIMDYVTPNVASNRYSLSQFQLNKIKLSQLLIPES